METKPEIRDAVAAGSLKSRASIILAVRTSDYGITPSGIVNATGLSKVVVSDLVEAMAKDGLVEKYYPERDKRTVSVYLTKKGAEKADAMTESLVDLGKALDQNSKSEDGVAEK